MKDNYFEQLKDQVDDIQKYSGSNGYDNFFKEEVIRFYSIAGTVLDSFSDVEKNINERMITHILLRSLLENFFWLLYIYDNDNDNDNDKANRFDEYLNSFKKEYAKLYNDSHLSIQNQIEKPDSNWTKLKNTKDLNSILTSMFNDHGDRLNHFYPLYRISSFDTHGKSLNSLFNLSFNKGCSFPYIKIEPIIDLMANQYLVTWLKVKP